MERLQKFWLAGVCRKDSDRKGDRSLPLEILNFTSAFILLAGGMVFAVLLLIFEHVYFKFLRVNLRKWDNGGCCSLVSLVRRFAALDPVAARGFVAPSENVFVAPPTPLPDSVCDHPDNLSCSWCTNMG